MNKLHACVADMLATLDTPDAFAQRMQAEESRLAAARAEQNRVWRERLSPTEVRLAPVLNSIPAEVQQQGISLLSLVPLLKGRYRERPRAGDLGEALRRLGWTRTRKWRGDAGGFRALWFPPTTNN